MAAAEGMAGRTSYTLGALLGAGSFGEVYLARMRTPAGIEQDVAVKLLHPGLHPKSQPVSRMRDEGQLLAALNHPAILAVKDLCTLEGRIGLVTEYLPGADLHDAIWDEQDPIGPRALLGAVSGMADALHAAWETLTPTGHKLGLVHRDIKPANVRLTPHGAVKLLDFGIAKSEDERRETATTERMAIGSPAYMAPEVQTYEVVDALPSRDVFALGCTLYEGLAHELFFEGLDTKAIVRLCNQRERFDAHAMGRLAKVAQQDRRVLSLVTQMLRFDHTKRPTARAVADLAAELADSLPGPTLRAWCRDHTWPEAQAQRGPWSGRQVIDAGGATSGARPAVAATYATPDASPPGAAGPTLVVPAAGATFVQIPVGVGGAQVHQVGTTQVVVVPAGPAPTRRRRVDVEGALAGLIGIVVLAGAYLLLVAPDAFSSLMRGDVVGAWSGVSGSFSSGVSSWDAPASDGASTGDAPQLAQGRQWGARPEQPPEVLAEIALDGSADVILARPGQPRLAMPADGSVLVPAGPVDVLARFSNLGVHGPQLSLHVADGDLVRIVCDARADSCVRR